MILLYFITYRIADYFHMEFIFAYFRGVLPTAKYNHAKKYNTWILIIGHALSKHVDVMWPWDVAESYC